MCRGGGLAWGGVSGAAGRLLRAVALSLAAAAAMPIQAQPAPLQGVQLVGHEGKALAPATLVGRPTLVHFIFTQCSTTCPSQVVELARVHEALSPAVREQVRFVSVSVDPLSDTPATLTAFARRMGALRKGWTFATGEPTEVHRLLDRMAIMNPARRGAAKPEDHRTSLYLFGADGQLVQRFRGVPVDVPRLRDELSSLAALQAPRR